MVTNGLLVTKEGYLKLQKEAEELRERRLLVLQKIKEAREQGDLSENAAYKSAREEQGFIDRRLDELDELFRVAKIAEKNGHCDKVDVGCDVVVGANGEEHRFQIVAPCEADPAQGKISYQSPLGQELLGKRVGDKMTIAAPVGEIVYTVREVS